MEGEKLISGGTPHADNVGPSILGGVVLLRGYEPLDIVRLPVPDNFCCSVVHPEIMVSTKVAREVLPKDIEWHFIGHLQTNKVKYIAPFISLIQSVDSLKLLKEIDAQAKKVNRVIDCLLEIHVAQEATKYGFSIDELRELFRARAFDVFENVNVVGLMGMASNTDDEARIREEFRLLSDFYQEMKNSLAPQIRELSMGMSHDYHIAVEEGSTLVRVGSFIFGERIYV